jgi:hypothetical protein
VIWSRWAMRAITGLGLVIKVHADMTNLYRS